MGVWDQQVEYSHILHLWVIMVVQNLRSVRSSGRFHGERVARAGAAPPPWTGSLCERPESPRCWRIKPEREKETETQDTGLSKETDSFRLSNWEYSRKCPLRLEQQLQCWMVKNVSQSLVSYGHFSFSFVTHILETAAKVSFKCSDP